MSIKHGQIINISLLSLITPTVKADELLLFKQDITPHHSWLVYALALGIMLIFILLLAKKNRSQLNQPGGCKLLEKKHLSNKTVLYILEYQQQRFILADNQQTMTVHPLTHEICNETP